MAEHNYCENCILILYQFEGLKRLFLIESTTLFTLKECKLNILESSNK